MADFGQFGVAHADKEERKAKTTTPNKDLGNEFTLVPDDFETHSLYELLPEGVYDFTVYDCAPDDPTKNGFSRMKVELQLTYQGREARVTDRIILSTNTIWRIGQFFKGLGMDEEILKNGGKVTMETWHAAVGRSGKFENKHRTYTDKWGREKSANNVEKYLAPAEKAVR